MRWTRCAVQAEDWLEDLGQDRADVREALMNMDMRGVPLADSPLCRYISLMVGKRTALSPCGLKMHLCDREGVVRVSVALPAPCVEFQVMFDSGAYPELEERVMLRDRDRRLDTPWGVAMATSPVCVGMLWAVADGGGGLLVTRGFADRRLSPAARSCAVPFGDWLTYAQAGEWACVAFECPAERDTLFNWNCAHVRPEHRESFLVLLLNAFCLDYLKCRQPELVLPGDVVCLGRDVHENGSADTGLTLAITNDGTRRVVTRTSYATAARRAAGGAFAYVRLGELEQVDPTEPWHPDTM